MVYKVITAAVEWHEEEINKANDLKELEQWYRHKSACENWQSSYDEFLEQIRRLKSRRRK